MSLSAAETNEFQSLPADYQERVMADIEKTGNRSPTFNMDIGKNGRPNLVQGSVFKDNEEAPGAKLIGALGSPEAKAAMAESDASRVAPPETAAPAGPLSQVGPMRQPEATPDPIGATAGALSSIYAANPVPTMQQALAQYAPQDSSRNMYLALAAGLGKATKTGSFGESMGNAADSVMQMKMEQEKLRMQYLPSIMNQMAAQRQATIQQQTMGLLGPMMSKLGDAPQGAPQGQPDQAMPQGAPQGAPQGQPMPQGQPTGAAPAMAQGAPQGQPMPQGAPQDPAQAVPQQQARQLQNAWEKAGMTRPLVPGEMMAILGSANPMEAFTAAVKEHTKLEGPALLAVQAGMPIGSPEYKKYIQDAAVKGNYIAPVAGRGGGYMHFADGHTEYNALLPEGMLANQNPNTLKMEYTQDPNIQAGMAAAEKAKLDGKNQQTLTPVDQAPRDGQGRVIPTPLSQTIAGAAAAPGSVPGAPQGVGLAPGQAEGATLAQQELSKKYSELQSQNTQAQTTTSYLQNIKQEAQKATVGQLSDKLSYLNGILANLGISDKATDAATANNLLSKYSNKIVASLSSGGLGTDAARTILQAAYPNSHMTLGAINEASDNLIGANEMTKAKHALLSPYGNARNPTAYQTNEQIFDNNADPRLYQYRNLAPGSAEAKAFLQRVMKSDPTFMDRAKALHDLGAY